MKEFLKYIFVLQEVSNKNKTPKLGRGFSKALRINPYNPLSYITIILYLIAGIIMFGVVGFWEEFKNPFKWD